MHIFLLGYCSNFRSSYALAEKLQTILCAKLRKMTFADQNLRRSLNEEYGGFQLNRWYGSKEHDLLLYVIAV